MHTVDSFREQAHNILPFNSHRCRLQQHVRRCVDLRRASIWEVSIPTMQMLIFMVWERALAENHLFYDAICKSSPRSLTSAAFSCIVCLSLWRGICVHVCVRYFFVFFARQTVRGSKEGETCWWINGWCARGETFTRCWDVTEKFLKVFEKLMLATSARTKFKQMIKYLQCSVAL